MTLIAVKRLQSLKRFTNAPAANEAICILDDHFVCQAVRLYGSLVPELDVFICARRCGGAARPARRGSAGAPDCEWSMRAALASSHAVAGRVPRYFLP